MEYSGIKTTFERVEIVLFKLLNLLLSLSLGYIVSKAGISNVFSPFSLALLAVAPLTTLSEGAILSGTIIGFATKEFSIFNFKYICANTVLYLIIILLGKKNYKEKIYSPVLPGVLCLFAGFIFIFEDGISFFSVFLLICESILCGCTSYFLKYFFDALKNKSKFEIRDFISFNITLLIFICALDNYTVSGFSLSIIFLILIFYICAYYLERRIAIIFMAPLCLIGAILHPFYDYFMITLYLPAIISVLITKYDKKYVILSYSIPFIIILLINNIIYIDLHLILSPIVAGLIFLLLPKKVLSDFLSNYIIIYNPKEIDSNSNSTICDDYCCSAIKLLNGINNNFYVPIINPTLENRLKKYMYFNSCRDISINNYYSNKDKQLISITFKTKDGKISVKSLQHKLNELTKTNFTLCDQIKQGNILTYKFEQSQNYGVECYALYKAKNGEIICGDNVTAFKTKDNMYALVLADGMGCGKAAYSKSFECISVIKKLFKSGIPVSKSLDATNSFLGLVKDYIGFSTVDICTISLDSAASNFYKCGSYISFVLRNKKLLTIKSGGYPLGLYDNVTYVRQNIELTDGDYIIMMSDGVANCIEELKIEILMSAKESLELFTRKLMDCAFVNTPKELDDDITILIAKITKKHE